MCSVRTVRVRNILYARVPVQKDVDACVVCLWRRQCGEKQSTNADTWRRLRVGGCGLVDGCGLWSYVLRLPIGLSSGGVESQCSHARLVVDAVTEHTWRACSARSTRVRSGRVFVVVAPLISYRRTCSGTVECVRVQTIWEKLSNRCSTTTSTSSGMGCKEIWCPSP